MNDHQRNDIRIGLERSEAIGWLQSLVTGSYTHPATSGHAADTLHAIARQAELPLEAFEWLYRHACSTLSSECRQYARRILKDLGYS